MSEPISRDEVAKVAELAMLELTDDELDTFTTQLAAVLTHATDVEALDVADVAPTNHPYPLVNVFRPDVADTTDRRDALLEAGPEVEDHMFRVPPVLGEQP